MRAFPIIFIPIVCLVVAAQGCGGGSQNQTLDACRSPLPPSAPGTPTYESYALPFPVNDAIYNAFTRKLYVSVPGTVADRGNRVIVVDPYTKAEVGAVFVGSEPAKLALSDDGKYLYVGLNGSGAVRRINLETLIADQSFDVNPGGVQYVEDMEVMPCNPNTVAISKRNFSSSPRHEGVAIYDNGVVRATKTPGHTGSNVIEFGASSNRLYGFNNETSESGFRRMKIDSAGVTVEDVFTSFDGDLLSGFTQDIAYQSARLFATDGRVIDPERKRALGTLSPVGDVSNSAVAPDTARGKVWLGGRVFTGFFISPVRITVYDLTTFTPITHADITSSSAEVTKLIRWGREGIAIRLSDGSVTLLSKAPGF